MRSILVAMLLMIVVVLIYSETLGGASGTETLLQTHAGKVSAAIQDINP